LQLHFGVVADRFLLLQQVAQQKSATKVYACHQGYIKLLLRPSLVIVDLNSHRSIRRVSLPPARHVPRHDRVRFTATITNTQLQVPALHGWRQRTNTPSTKGVAGDQLNSTLLWHPCSLNSWTGKYIVAQCNLVQWNHIHTFTAQCKQNALF